MDVEVENVLRFIRQHKSKNYVEIEFRLGRKNNSVFDTNVGNELFQKALKALRGYQGWESIIEKNEQIYYGARKGLRIVYNESTDDQICITKHQAGVLDIVLNGFPTDVRVASSIEIPSTYDNEKDHFPTQKKRKRISFVRKGLSIDLSELVTTGQQDDMDEESQKQYQIEFEILDLKEIDDNRAFNHYNKIFDLMKCL
jgi:hypothetical protein